MASQVTVTTLNKMKEKGEKIVALTAYDFPFAKLVDEAGIDMILVGDSLGMVVQGNASTLPVTMEEMLYHTRMVARAAGRAMVVGDMPFMSYQASRAQAIDNAGRFLKETGAQTVKLEGGIEVAPIVKRLFEFGIPVMGHIGMTPQSINRFGRPKVQGKTEQSRQYLIESALALEEAGAYSIVLELIEQSAAKEISERIKIPTIGIGSGPYCDGQVLVINDILGLYDEFQPKFVRRYADLPDIIEKAARSYISDVKSGNYPSKDESF